MPFGTAGRRAGLAAAVVLAAALLGAAAHAGSVTITATAGKGGHIVPGGKVTVEQGASQTFKIVPETGHEIGGVKVGGRSVGAVDRYTFENVEKDGKLTASFKPRTFTVQASGADGVQLRPAGTIPATYGKTLRFTISLPKGDSGRPTARVDAQPVALRPSGKSFKFTLVVQGDHVVAASMTPPVRVQVRPSPSYGAPPLGVRLSPVVEAPADDPIAFLAWDWDGDGAWDSCDPARPAEGPSPCETVPIARDHLYPASGRFAPTLIVRTRSGERATGSAVLAVNGPTSEVLILAALAAGRLDEATAVLYRVYAVFGDPRLPPEYRGDDVNERESGVLRELAQRFEALPPDVALLVAPFLMPPAYAGSWYAQQVEGAAARLAGGGPVAADPLATSRPKCTDLFGSWAFAEGAGSRSRVRVWYDAGAHPELASRAAWVAAEMTDVVWPKLQALFRREPPSDRFGLCNGGDGKLDIYIVDGLAGYGEWVPERCGASPGFMLVSRWAAERGTRGTLAHELFHAFQSAYDIGGCEGAAPYRWWTEATATWGEDHVYPAMGPPENEHQYLPDYLDDMQLSIDMDSKPRYYGAYIFPFFVARSLSANYIPLTWAQMERDKSTPVEAIDTVLKLEKTWPEFARLTWNRVPVDEYERWDGIRHHPPPTREFEIGALPGGERETRLEGLSLPPLTVVYYRFTFAGADASTVTFYNGLTWQLAHGPLPLFYAYGTGYHATPLPGSDTEGISIQALLRIDGRWRAAEDWTEAPFVTLCRDRRSEDVEELVLIVANASPTRDRTVAPRGEPPVVRVTNIGCHEWRGTASLTHTGGGLTHTLTVRDMRFRQGGVSVTPGVATAAALPGFGPVSRVASTFVLVDGRADYAVTGTQVDGCRVEGSRPDIPLGHPRGPDVPTLSLYEDITGGTAHRRFSLTGFAPDVDEQVSVRLCCPGQACHTQKWTITDWITVDPLLPFLPERRVSEDGRRLHGDGSDAPPPSHHSGTWELEAVYE